MSFKEAFFISKALCLSFTEPNIPSERTFHSSFETWLFFHLAFLMDPIKKKELFIWRDEERFFLFLFIFLGGERFFLNGVFFDSYFANTLWFFQYHPNSISTFFRTNSGSHLLPSLFSPAHHDSFLFSATQGSKRWRLRSCRVWDLSSNPGSATQWLCDLDWPKPQFPNFKIGTIIEPISLSLCED